MTRADLVHAVVVRHGVDEVLELAQVSGRACLEVLGLEAGCCSVPTELAAGAWCSGAVFVSPGDVECPEA